MATKHRINHRIKNQTWVRPELGYDAWLKLNNYAKENSMDFPSAVDLAATIITDQKANELALKDSIEVIDVFRNAIDLYYQRKIK